MEFNKYGRAWSALFLGVVAAFPLTVFGQSSSSASPYKYLDLPDGSRQIVPASDTRASYQGQQIWNNATSNTANGSVQVGRNFSTPSPQGVQVPAVATGRLPPAQVAAAVFRFANKVITPISIGVGIYELAKELGFTSKNKAGGGIEVAQVPQGFDGYEYLGKNYVYYSTQGAACASRNSTSTPDSSGRYRVSTYSKGSTTTACLANLVDYPGGEVYYSGEIDITERGSAIASPTPTPVPLQTFIDAVAAKSGWPAASKVNEVILGDPSPELQKPQEITVSGPATSPGPKSTTVNNTKGTTTTNTNTNNYSYVGDKITNNITNTTVTVDNSTGAITNNETTTAAAPPPQPPAPTPDKCAPGSTELNCAALDTPEGEIPKVTKDVSYQAESMFGGGACPADVSVPQRTTGRPVVMSYATTCNALANYVKPIIIAIALFMAYLIILPGRSD